MGFKIYDIGTPTLTLSFDRSSIHLHLSIHTASTDVSQQSYIARSDPSLASFDESYVDAYSRSILITSLLLDERPGALAQMVEMSYPGHNPGGQPPMSPTVTAVAADLKRAAEENAEAISWVGRMGR
jgi:hypothetical protein